MIMDPDFEYVVSVSYLAMKVQESGVVRVSVWDDRKVGRSLFLKLDEGVDPRRALVDLDRDEVKSRLFKGKLKIIDIPATLAGLSDRVDYAQVNGLISSDQGERCRNVIATARNEISAMGRRQSAKNDRVADAVADLAKIAKAHPRFFSIVHNECPRPAQFMEEIWEPLMQCISAELEETSEPSLMI